MIFQKAKEEKVKEEKTNVPEAPTMFQSFADGPTFGLLGFPGDSIVKSPPAKAKDVGSVPGLGRSPGEGHDKPLQYSCLENPLDRRAWRATVHGVTKESYMT